MTTNYNVYTISLVSKKVNFFPKVECCTVVKLAIEYISLTLKGECEVIETMIVLVDKYGSRYFLIMDKSRSK